MKREKDRLKERKKDRRERKKESSLSKGWKWRGKIETRKEIREYLFPWKECNWRQSNFEWQRKWEGRILSEKRKYQQQRERGSGIKLQFFPLQ